MVFGLAREVEELGDLGSHGGHDGGVEQCVETGEQERTDNDRNKDLYAGIDVAFAANVGDGGLGGYRDGIDLVRDGIKELFHRIKYLVFFLFFDFDLVLICVLRITSFRRAGRFR